MATVAVPYHLDERLVGFAPGVRSTTKWPWPSHPETPGSAWPCCASRSPSRSAARTLLRWWSRGTAPTSLGVLAGLQRGGHDVGIVWLDAHADSTPRPRQRPLALAVGVGTLTLPAALGLGPIPESRVVLVDARATDPGERVLLDRSAVVRTRVAALDEGVLPAGELYLHVDLDVCDPAQVPNLLYPEPGGIAPDDLVAAVRRVVATGRVAAVGVGATWHHDGRAAAPHRDLLRALVRASAR